ncbi:ATP-dependent zinc protease [Oceanihabitans sp. IOP_32]|uniref:ATP-dependent zinc protease family protein n=1 Tax=Oceanihabitans sp. IOP_32 TaxID=2529032 RepID=UPI00293B9F7C|nr:RimK/LysX family protein [Oceanihabitans sp. IOP_32]
MKKIIGRTDLIDFPELDLWNIGAKIDSGAYTSAIHCSEIIEEHDALKCTFSSKKHPNFNSKNIVFKTFSRTVVKSSNGQKEQRYKIKTKTVLFGKTYTIYLTLTTRDNMKYPVLIGRQFLSKKFLIDVDAVNESYKNKLK